MTVFERLKEAGWSSTDVRVAVLEHLVERLMTEMNVHGVTQKRLIGDSIRDVIGQLPRPKPVKVVIKEECQTCDGFGYYGSSGGHDPGMDCETCQGSGYV